MSARERWGAALRSWAIPGDILARAPTSPWAFPVELFRARADRAATHDPTPTVERAREALPGGGTVLDVGVGAGATSLPLAPQASRIVGVDTSEDMLREFREGAAASGTDAAAILGRWPDVASATEQAHVVVCGHVLYNAQDLEPFARALDEHARRRVVVEITATHPLAWMGDLWLAFHALERPTEPTADDAEDALRESGFEVEREDFARPAGGGGFARRDDAVALIRRRLCLEPDRDDEVAAALGDRLAQRDGLWSAGPPRQALVTLWWEPSA